MAANAIGIETCSFERLERLDERFRRLLREEETGFPFDDGFQRSTGTISDDRAAAGLRLQRCEPVVLLLRKDQRTAGGIEIEQDFVGHVSKEEHVAAAGELFELGSLRSVPDDDQATAEPRCSLD